MEIIKTNVEATDKKTLYKLTHSDGVNVKDCENGETFKLVKYAIFTKEFEKRDGSADSNTVLAMIDEEGVSRHTISPYFIDSFKEILEIFGDDIPELAISKKQSKTGRTFVSVTVA